MNIDYDWLKDLLNERTTGQWQFHIYEPDPYCYPGAVRFLVAADWDRVEIAEGQAGPSTESSEYARKVSDFELMALAPDMACELLRLRDGIERVVAQMNDHATTLRRLEHHSVAFHMEEYARLLTRQLDGDAE